MHHFFTNRHELHGDISDETYKYICICYHLQILKCHRKLNIFSRKTKTSLKNLEGKRFCDGCGTACQISEQRAGNKISRSWSLACINSLNLSVLSMDAKTPECTSKFYPANKFEKSAIGWSIGYKYISGVVHQNNASRPRTNNYTPFYSIHVPGWLQKWLNLITAPGSVSNEPGSVTWLATKYLKTVSWRNHTEKLTTCWAQNISFWLKINIPSSYFTILMLNCLENTLKLQFDSYVTAVRFLT